MILVSHDVGWQCADTFARFYAHWRAFKLDMDRSVRLPALRRVGCGACRWTSGSRRSANT